jgi:hypothetical protein
VRDFHPKAERVDGNDAGSYTGGSPKLLWHSTEGSSADGAIDAYRTNNSWPHFTAEFRDGRFKLFQHIPLSKAARSLEHPAGTGETNRNRVIQVEIVGFAAQAQRFPDQLYAGLADLARFVEKEFGVLAVARFPFLPPDRPAARLSFGEWNRYSGHLGHQHAPFNHHTDPGKIKIERILTAPTYASRKIGQGDGGPDIEEFQRHLNKRLAARDLATIEANGTYDMATERARDDVTHMLGFPLSVVHGDGATPRVQEFIKDPKKRPAKYLETAKKRKQLEEQEELHQQVH